jgi:hypothetical protein
MSAMSPRKNPRLAYCEYVLPDSEHSTATEMARRDLMRAVERCHRVMLEKLSHSVFPAYAELAKSGFGFDDILWHPRLSPHTLIPETSPLKSALSEWAREFHAENGWFLDDALRTLRGWFVAPDWRESLRWNPNGRLSYTVAMGERFHFDSVGWEMQLLTWARYSQSVREEFEQKLDEYAAASRKLAESRGLVRAPHKYSPVNLDWFVLYQFKGLSSAEIAGLDESPNSLNESTVQKGVRTASRLVGWQQLRPRLKNTNRKIR